MGIYETDLKHFKVEVEAGKSSVESYSISNSGIKLPNYWLIVVILDAKVGKDQRVTRIDHFSSLIFLF